MDFNNNPDRSILGISNFTTNISMKIKRHKALHGWVFEITDSENKEKWVSNIEGNIKEAKSGAIAAFIYDRKELIKAKQGDIKTLMAQIDKAEKL